MKAIADIRRTLHEHPGVSNHEEFAHDLIISELAQLKPTRVHDHVGGYGVVAVWGEKPSAPTVAFRADNDALPIGHRCGHDGHTSILLRLARLVDANPPKDGNVLLLWQPAEETGEGSQRVIDSGILQQYNIKAMFGLHNLPGFDEGCTVLAHRTFAAASTGVVYHFEGRETHASTPELGVNPGLAVAALIERILAMNSHRSIDDFRQATLICVELGQPAFGTSAGSAGTLPLVGGFRALPAAFPRRHVRRRRRSTSPRAAPSRLRFPRRHHRARRPTFPPSGKKNREILVSQPQKV